MVHSLDIVLWPPLQRTSLFLQANQFCFCFTCSVGCCACGSRTRIFKSDIRVCRIPNTCTFLPSGHRNYKGAANDVESSVQTSETL